MTKQLQVNADAKAAVETKVQENLAKRAEERKNSNALPNDAIQKKTATVKNPTIEAIIHGLFRFENIDQVKLRLDSVRDFFIISAEQDEDQENNPSVKLWIKGFNVTEDEAKEGYIGHFAVIKPMQVDGGKISLVAEKTLVELDTHPQKKRGKHKHPNWGHPVLRSVKKKKVFNTVEDAQAQLMKLHEEYPDTSIPTMNKLYIILYSRAEEGVKPIQKWVLEIKVGEQGGFTIEASANTYDASKKKPVVVNKKDLPAGAPGAANAGGGDPDNMGKFASMVELKRSRKRGPMPSGADKLAAEKAEAGDKPEENKEE